MFNSETLLMMQDQPYFSKIDKISDREEQGTFYFQNETGYGKIEVYRILPGFELHYNDINMSYMDEGLFYGCDDKDNDIIEINHCSRGRYECDSGTRSTCYISPGDLSISPMFKPKIASGFPLNHYYGVAVYINAKKIPNELKSLFKILTIDLSKLYSIICSEKHHIIVRANESIQHIFSELYSLREKRKLGYMRVKTLELLLFLSDFCDDDLKCEERYFDLIRVHKIKEIRDFMVSDISKHYTIEELSKKFEIAPTSMKKCFKGVYGTSIYAYLRTYRLQSAQEMSMNSSASVSEIAVRVGYSNPNKFMAAFKQEYGITPMRFRKSVCEDRIMSE